MSRIPLVEPESAPPEVQAIYKDIQAEGMELLNVLKMFGNNQNFLAAMLQMIRGLYSDRSKLSPVIASWRTCARRSLTPAIIEFPPT